jgi:hypothetical protein
VQRYYFNLSCEANYIEDIMVGIDAFNPEEAEQQIDKYTSGERLDFAREFLVTNRQLVSPRDFTEITLIENTELEEEND